MLLEGRDSLFSSNHMSLQTIRLDRNGIPLDGIAPGSTDTDYNNLNVDTLVGMIKNQEGCAVFGSLFAKKVSGFIYFNERRLDSIPGLKEKTDLKTLNFSHKVNSVSFGTKKELVSLKQNLNKLLSPLEGTIKNEVKSDSPGTLFQYYLNVVPIKYVPLYGSDVYGYQYTANSHKVDYYHKNSVVVR